MNSKLKLQEVEEKARKIFGENFIGLSEACAVLGKTLKEKELRSFCFFSIDDIALERYAKQGFCLITVPVRMTVKEIITAAPNLFVFNLSDGEMYSLSKEIIKPGRYLVKREPTYKSFNKMMMQEMGILSENNPKLVEVMCAFALTHLTGKRRMLIERICVICKEEVQRRFGKAHLCFQKDSGTAIKIGVWLSQIPSLSSLPIKRA